MNADLGSTYVQAFKNAFVSDRDKILTVRCIMSFLKKIVAILSVILSLFAVSTCGPSSPLSVPPSLAWDTHTPLPTDTSTLIPTFTGTNTPVPPTNTPIPPTETPIPTLAQAAANARFEELMQMNGNCQLPCWWGIVPGITNYQEAENILAPLRSLSPFELGKGTLDVIYLHDKNEIHMDIWPLTLPEVDKISLLQINTQVLHPINKTDFEIILNDPKYLGLMKNYSLSAILSTLGKPDEIISKMEINAEDGRPAYLDMHLLYPGKGFFIGYRMYPQLIGNQVIACTQKSFINLWLMAPSQDTSYEGILSGLSQDWYGYFLKDNETLLQLDKIDHMTVDSFYERFRKSTSDCLTTSRSIWPRP